MDFIAIIETYNSFSSAEKFISLFLYFLPVIVSVSRGGHKNILILFMINLFLGWTIITWIVLLFYSFLFKLDLSEEDETSRFK